MITKLTPEQIEELKAEFKRDTEYNSTDFGEMGQFIRVEYVLNVFKRVMQKNFTDIETKTWKWDEEE